MSTLALDSKPVIDSPGPRKNLILAVMSLSTFLIFLDGTVVNTALPAISREFSASNSTLQWIVNMYSLILAGLLLVAGSTGDRFGRRKALAAGMVIFGVGAAGAALAESTSMLIAMRGVQGLGAAFALPATLSIITDVFPRGERAKAIATWTAIGATGIAVGPALGGFLVDEVGWNAVFWLHMPVVALSIVGLAAVPESRDSRRLPIDLPGALFVTAGSLSVVYGIIQGGEAGWASLEIVGSISAGIALLLVFAAIEVKSASPMLPLHYFKRMDFTGSFLVLMLLFFGMVGVFFFLTQFLQLVQGRSALVAGLAITPVAATMMIGTVVSTKVVPRFGPKVTIVGATLIVMSGMVVFSQIAIDSPYWVPVLGIMLFGLGAGIAMPTVTDTIMAAVPVNDAGIGSAMNDLSRELGITLGVAVLGSLVASLYRSDVRDALDGAAPQGVVESVSESVGVVDRITGELSPALATLVENTAYQSFVDALSIGFLAAAGFVAVAMLVALVLIPNRTRTVQGELGEEGSLDDEGPVDLALGHAVLADVSIP